MACLGRFLIHSLRTSKLILIHFFRWREKRDVILKQKQFKFLINKKISYKNKSLKFFFQFSQDVKIYFFYNEKLQKKIIKHR